MSTEELVEEKIVETEQCMTSEPFREFTFKEQKFITAFVIMIGLLIGIGILLSRQRLEILITLNVIFIIISILAEIIIKNKLSESKLQYQLPAYGIAGLVFDIFGLILIVVFDVHGLMSFYIWNNLFAAPLAFMVIICSLAGFYYNKDSSPAVSIIGLFLGGILLLISFWQVLAFKGLVTAVIAYIAGGGEIP